VVLWPFLSYGFCPLNIHSFIHSSCRCCNESTMARVIAAGDGFGFMCVDNASGFTERSETAREGKVCVCVCVCV